jgi:hypothetical protein
VAAGVYHQHWRLRHALDELGWDAAIGKASKGEWSGHELSFWPEDYAQMMSYDVVVLENVDPRALGDEVLEMLREYVQHGGGLVVLGGPQAFTAEGYPRTQLATMLPVTYPGSMALTPVTDGAVQVTGDRPQVEGLTLSGKPQCYWSHDSASSREPRCGSRPESGRCW